MGPTRTDEDSEESSEENPERAETSLGVKSTDGDTSQDDDDSDKDPPTPRKKKKKVHRLSLTKTEDFNEKLRKRGVLYVARVPPRMTPTKLKNLLSGMGDGGEVTRLYLVEEDAAVRRRRRKSGGSGSKRYVEGWVEFSKKRVAKHVAQYLNNTPISNHKRDAHCGDLWNLKYLPGFKWSHLTEKVAYERRVREQKLRIEMMQARRENAAYTQLVETGKKLDKIEARKRRRAEKEGKDPSTVLESQKKRRKPRQNKPLEEGATKSTKKALLGSLVA